MRSTSTHAGPAAIVLCMLVLLCLGCGRATRSGTETGTVRLQLNWIPDAQHGGFYAAFTEGFYEQEGLDVEIVPGGPGTPMIPKITMGQCEFAVANADQILLARQQGADLIALFASMQDSPRCIMVHETSNIHSLEELKNVVLAIGEGKAYAEYLKSKVPLDGVRLVSYSGSVAKFLIDDDFAQQGYVFSEPLVVEARGKRARVLMVSEIGFNPYSSVLITRRELWEEEPDLVRRFARATRRGWEAYLRDPTRTNQAILRVNPEMDAEILARSVAAIRPLCLPGGTSENDLGRMNADRWRTLYRQLIDLQLLPEGGQQPEDAFINVLGEENSLSP